MVAGGMDRVFYGVGSMTKALAFYRDYIGLKVVAEMTLGRPEIEGLFTVPAGTTARAALLKNDLQDTLIELIEFNPA